MTKRIPRKDVPIPPCNNTNRRTYKCRRMCCARRDDRVIEKNAPGKQMQLGLSRIGNWCSAGCCDLDDPSDNYCRR